MCLVQEADSPLQALDSQALDVFFLFVFNVFFFWGGLILLFVLFLFFLRFFGA